MTDKEIYKEIKKYFFIQEIVSPKVFKKYGNTAWKFIDVRLLHTLLIIRTNLKKPITINTWHKKGSFKQRGLRSNLGYIFMSKFKKGVLYLSGHVLGKAVDFDVKGMQAEQVREWIKENEKLFPYKIRLEHIMKGKPINWIHLDMIWESKNKDIHFFNV